MWWSLWGSKSWRQGDPDLLARAGAEPNIRGSELSRLREALPLIAVEFERARRYERSVTVAVFTGPAARAGNGANGHHAPGAVDPRSLAGVLASATREVDLVTCHAHSCVVVLPEIGPEEGIRAVRRMREVCAGRLSAPIAAGIAVFPEDGWLFLDLVDVALRNARTAGDEERAAVRDGAMVADQAGVPVRAERAQGT